METTIMGYIRTTIRIHSFIPSWRLVLLDSRGGLGSCHGRLPFEDPVSQVNMVQREKGL